MLIEAYPSAPSVYQGEVIKFHAGIRRGGKAATAQICVVRVGLKGGSVQQVHEGACAVKEQVLRGDEYEVGCGWPSCYALRIPSGWASGIYRVDLRVEQSGAVTSIYFIVKALPNRTAKILLASCYTTIQAYNSFGGRSLYRQGDDPNYDYTKRARRVSFERPIEDVILGDSGERVNGYYFWNGKREIGFLEWLDDNGFRADCCTSLELHSEPELLNRYQLLLSVGHDEYWSKGMRDNVEAFTVAGGNVAFFSANTCYWQVRLEDDNRKMVCYKSAMEDPLNASRPDLTTVKWHEPPVNRPPNSMMGLSGKYGSQDQSINFYERVIFPQHWVFEGTEQAECQPHTFPRLGGKRPIVGYETDAIDYRLVKGLLNQLDPEGVPTALGSDGTPSSFVILATAHLRLRPPVYGKAGDCVMGLFHNGGTVFTAGTIDWYRDLVLERDPDDPPAARPHLGDENVRRVTYNVVRRLEARNCDWEEIDLIQSVVALTVMGGTLYMVNDADGYKLWKRDLVCQNVGWAEITGLDGVDITAIAGADSESLMGYFEARARLWCSRRVSSQECGLFIQSTNGHDWVRVGRLPVGFSLMCSLAVTSRYILAFDRTSNKLWICEVGVYSWDEVRLPRLGRVKSCAAAFADLILVTEGDELWHHPAQAPNEWNHDLWSLVDVGVPHVDVIAAGGGKVIGAKRVRDGHSLLYWRDVNFKNMTELFNPMPEHRMC